MPKQKTHKASKKRFRVTATGKVKHRPAGNRHLASRKNRKQKRNLGGTVCLAPMEAIRILNCLRGNSY